jgi:tRNA A-37 threonylcarbamoyl transferase component Bud32
MTYMGKSLYTDFVLPADWKEQISSLFTTLSEANIYYPEFNLKNILLLDGRLSFVDFGLATLDADKMNADNEKVFVGLLETLDNKFRTLDNPEQKRVLYSTFINNLKIENTTPNNIF